MKRVFVFDFQFPSRSHGGLVEDNYHRFNFDASEDILWTPKAIFQKLEDEALPIGQIFYFIPKLPISFFSKILKYNKDIPLSEYEDRIVFGSWCYGDTDSKGYPVITSSRLILSSNKNGTLKVENVDGVKKGRVVIFILTGFDKAEKKRLITYMVKNDLLDE